MLPKVFSKKAEKHYKWIVLLAWVILLLFVFYRGYRLLDQRYNPSLFSCQNTLARLNRISKRKSRLFPRGPYPKIIYKDQEDRLPENRQKLSDFVNDCRAQGFYTREKIFAHIQPEVLEHNGRRVVDEADLLSILEERAITKKIEKLEQDTGAQVVLVTLPGTKPLSIEQFSILLAERWQIGRKGVDDGILITVASKDRKMRIEVGYGLEGRIPDVVAKRIIDRYMVPFFKKKNYAGGIESGVDKIIALIRREALPIPTVEAYEDPTWYPIVKIIGGLIFAMLIMFAPFFGFLIIPLYYFCATKARGTPLLLLNWGAQSLVLITYVNWSNMWPAHSSLMANSVIQGGILIILLNGLFIWFVILFAPDDGWDCSSGGGGGSGGSFSSSSGSSFSSSSSSSSSFSGGGGSFGGGGASGSW